jgi:hypothetical protein
MLHYQDIVLNLVNLQLSLNKINKKFDFDILINLL